MQTTGAHPADPPGPHPVSRRRHLFPALAAALTVALLLVGLDAYSRRRIRQATTVLAALNLPENTRGTTLQRRLFALPARLPVYGSSELAIVQSTRADLLLRRRQHGCDAFVVGQAGDRCLLILQELAALGEAVRGRKIAIFLSPSWFLPPPTGRAGNHPDHRQMAATFSPLQAGRLLVDSPLRLATKQAVAARLLDYDNVVRDRSILVHLALTGLEARPWVRRGQWFAVYPLLKLQNRFLAWQDRCHLLALTCARPALKLAAPRYRSRHKTFEWARTLAEVTRAEAKRRRATPGTGETFLAGAGELRRAARLDRDEDFLRRMAASPEWTDLDLLLRTLRELGARPVLVGQPINGPSSDGEGITPRARRQYYDRVQKVAAAYRVPLRDFSAYEEDPTFFLDLVHPSARAWVLYDQALAGFYHGKRG